VNPPLATVVAAAIAALTAVGGYLSTQRWKRRDEKIRLYADALQAVRRYEERELDATMQMELTTRIRSLARELNALRPPPPRI
jgi:hypothetical protein